MTGIQLAAVDWLIIGIYFAFILGLGFYLQRFTKTQEDFFIAGRKNSSWVAGIAFLSANLGALELLGMTGMTFKYGLYVAHFYWMNDRKPLALYLQSRISEVFAVDIHPGARIGKGIMFDHATSVVIGETAVVEDDFSMLHEVTLGGTGKQGGDRHPKIGRGVLVWSPSNLTHYMASWDGKRFRPWVLGEQERIGITHSHY